MSYEVLNVIQELEKPGETILSPPTTPVGVKINQADLTAAYDKMSFTVQNCRKNFLLPVHLVKF